jgi:hypothetical protein
MNVKVLLDSKPIGYRARDLSNINFVCLLTEEKIMKLNEKEKSVLVGVMRDVARISSMSRESVRRFGAWKVRDARDGYAAVNLACWIGHTPTPSERVMYCRAYSRLERLGLLERANLYGYSEKASHLRLTEEGKAIARQLADGVEELHARGKNTVSHIYWGTGSGMRPDGGLVVP